MGVIRPPFRSGSLGILTCSSGAKLDILERGATGHSGRTRGSFKTLLESAFRPSLRRPLARTPEFMPRVPATMAGDGSVHVWVCGWKPPRFGNRVAMSGVERVKKANKKPCCLQRASRASKGPGFRKTCGLAALLVHLRCGDRVPIRLFMDRGHKPPLGKDTITSAQAHSQRRGGYGCPL
jgi:hypothetical protein